MRLASLSDSAKNVLASSLMAFMEGAGQVRLVEERGSASQNLSCRGAIAEAQLGLETLHVFLAAQAGHIAPFFDRLRGFLLDGDQPIGSVGLVRGEGQKYEFEHVTLGDVEALAETLTEIEPLAGDLEARLVQIPEIYLTTVVLVENERTVSFHVVTPPYPRALEARTPEQFRVLLSELVAEHRRVFPPEG